MNMEMQIKKVGDDLYATTKRNRAKDYDLACAPTVGMVTVKNYCGNIYAGTMQDHIIEVKKRVVDAYKKGIIEIED